MVFHHSEIFKMITVSMDESFKCKGKCVPEVRKMKSCKNIILFHFSDFSTKIVDGNENAGAGMKKNKINYFGFAMNYASVLTKKFNNFQMTILACRMNWSAPLK